MGAQGEGTPLPEIGRSPNTAKNDSPESAARRRRAQRAVDGATSRGPPIGFPTPGSVACCWGSELATTGQSQSTRSRARRRARAPGRKKGLRVDGATIVEHARHPSHPPTTTHPRQSHRHATTPARQPPTAQHPSHASHRHPPTQDNPRHRRTATEPSPVSDQRINARDAWPATPRSGCRARDCRHRARRTRPGWGDRDRPGP